MVARRLGFACSLVALAAVGCGDGEAGAGGEGGVGWSSGAGAGGGGSTATGEGGGPPAASPLALVVRSERATRIDVYVYPTAIGSDAVLVRTLDRGTGADDDRWTVTIPRHDLEAAGVTGAVHYGLRAWGPNWPFDAAWVPGSSAGFIADVDAEGNRFNPNKLLIDPYAREISHDPVTPEKTDGTVYRTGPDDRARDSGPVAPKSIAFDEPSVDLGVRPAGPLSSDTIYEVHVRGFTMSDPGVDPACRGTYRAAGEKAGYLADLGVTAIELLPVHETPNATNDVEASTSGDNYWGYSTLAFFAPDRRYACDQTPGGPTREFREMVFAMHAAGIKVFIDVVYNHTSEGGVGDPDVTRLYSLRGLDNAGYYELDDDARFYADNTGIGANTNAANEMVRDLTIDSLRYWHEAMGVDGFRFDLASVLANACETECFSFEPDDPSGILARAVAELPARPADGGPGPDLIAEPWGIGPGTYQIGNYPPGFAEWNGIYRDTLRRDQNRLDVEAVTPRELVDRIGGSPGLYADDGRTPGASVNFLVAHDGFTLRDLYACNAKDNDQPWPYGPSDGGENNNLSWDYGGDPSRQRQAWRTGLALLVLSAGAPMLTGGDELYRSQACNNNAYNIDAFTNWLDWSAATTHPELVRFAREALRFRRAHPALRPAGWPDWAFLTDAGAAVTSAYLDSPNNHFLAWRIDGAGAGDTARSLLVFYNGHLGTVFGAVPPAAAGHAWRLVLDTSASAEPFGNVHEPGAEPVFDAATYDVPARSVVVLVETAR